MGTFEEYIERYSQIYGVPIERIMEIAIVREVKAYYDEEYSGLYLEDVLDSIKEVMKDGH
jgi:hypothetical protein